MKNYIKLAKWATSQTGKDFLNKLNAVRLRAVESANDDSCDNESCKSLRRDVLILNTNLETLDDQFEIGL